MNSNNSKRLILVKQKRNYKNTETDLKATYEQARWKKEGELAPLERTQSRRQQRTAQKQREKWLQRCPTPLQPHACFGLRSRPPARPLALRAATPPPNTHTTLTEESKKMGAEGGDYGTRRELGEGKISSRTWYVLHTQ